MNDQIVPWKHKGFLQEMKLDKPEVLRPRDASDIFQSCHHSHLWAMLSLLPQLQTEIWRKECVMVYLEDDANKINFGFSAETDNEHDTYLAIYP